MGRELFCFMQEGCGREHTQGDAAQREKQLQESCPQFGCVCVNINNSCLPLGLPRHCHSAQYWEHPLLYPALQNKGFEALLDEIAVVCSVASALPFESLKAVFILLSPSSHSALYHRTHQLLFWWWFLHVGNDSMRNLCFLCSDVSFTALNSTLKKSLRHHPVESYKSPCLCWAVSKGIHPTRDRQSWKESCLLITATI